MIRSLLSLFFIGALLIFAVCTAAQSTDSPGSANSFAAPSGGCAPISAADESSSHGFDLANLDRSVAPCDDFFHFAAGGWIKKNPIPPAYSRWGTFNILNDRNQDVLKTILEQASADKSAKPGSNWQKIGDFYASCMDTAAIDAAGIKPLEPEFDRIAAIKNASELQMEFARLEHEGVDAGFGFGSSPDYKDSTKSIATLVQGGLGLPDREYYLRDEDKDKQLREAYLQHVTNMFKLLGDNEATAAAEAKTVAGIETSLAKVSMTRVDRRDPDKTYHMLSLAQLHELAPGFAWEAYFKELGAPAFANVNVSQPEFFKGVDAEFASVPLADWKVYLRWHVIHAVAESLPSKFEEENFNFYGKTLTGAKEMLPRWRRCVASTDRQLGEALGQFYVQRAFPPEAKAKAVGMVKNLMAAFRADFETLDWMSPATRAQAIKKLDAIEIKIGYPDKWRDYSAFLVVRTPYVENFLRGSRFEDARDLAKIGKPMDRSEWTMTPPTVNAYYRASNNDISFPAGILQPPFYDPNRDDAMNYGGIGAVIGHELTHGFDDQGSKFDAHGNLNNWWTPEDLKNFETRGDCIAKQFDSFEVEPGLHENGKLEEGESIADLGGLTIAYAAFHKTLEGKPQPAPIDGFTADQRFFLAWAQVWAGSTRPERARMLAINDPHPLDRFRVRGPMSNLPAFAKAFGCSADSPMVRAEGIRCRVW